MPVCLALALAIPASTGAQEINSAGKSSIAEADFIVMPTFRFFNSGLAAKRVWIVRKRTSGGRSGIEVRIKGEDDYVHLADGGAGDTLEVHPIFLNIAIIRRTVGFDRRTYYYECEKESDAGIVCTEGEELK